MSVCLFSKILTKIAFFEQISANIKFSYIFAQESNILDFCKCLCHYMMPQKQNKAFKTDLFKLNVYTRGAMYTLLKVPGPIASDFFSNVSNQCKHTVKIMLIASHNINKHIIQCI